MTDSITIDANIDELFTTLTQLVESADPIAHKAVSKAITPISGAFRKAMPTPNPKRQARRKNGVAMKRAVKRKVRKARGNKPAQAKTGFNVGLRRGDNRRAYHAHLAVLGTRERMRKNGMRTGRVGPTAVALRSRIRSSLGAAVPKAWAAAEKEIANQLEKAFVK